MEEHVYAMGEEYPVAVVEELDRITWTYDETLALIDAVEENYGSFTYPRRRKFVWDIVCNDLKARDIIRTSKQCADKWKNLIRTYKSCRDAIKKSGRYPVRFLFFDRIAEFFVKRQVLRMLPVASTQSAEKPPKVEYQVPNIKLTTISLLEKKVNIEEKKLKEKLEENERRERRWQERLEFVQKKLGLEERKLIALENFTDKQ